MMKRIKTAVIGASGYSGIELLRILVRHPGAELVAVTSRQFAGKTLETVFPRFRACGPEAVLKFIEPQLRSLVDQPPSLVSFRDPLIGLMCSYYLLISRRRRSPAEKAERARLALSQMQPASAGYSPGSAE